MYNRKDFTGAKNMAHITLTLNENGQCGIHWKGDTIQLADMEKDSVHVAGKSFIKDDD